MCHQVPNAPAATAAPSTTQCHFMRARCRIALAPPFIVPPLALVVTIGRAIAPTSAARLLANLVWAHGVARQQQPIAQTILVLRPIPRLSRRRPTHLRNTFLSGGDLHLQIQSLARDAIPMLGRHPKINLRQSHLRQVIPGLRSQGRVALMREQVSQQCRRPVQCPYTLLRQRG
jgi:hypothetical protein